MQFVNFTNAGSDEQRFLEAAMAYVAGKPILSDEEYDKLKLRLKVCFQVLFIFGNLCFDHLDTLSWKQQILSF